MAITVDFIKLPRTIGVTVELKYCRPKFHNILAQLALPATEAWGGCDTWNRIACPRRSL